MYINMCTSAGISWLFKHEIEFKEFVLASFTPCPWTMDIIVAGQDKEKFIGMCVYVCGVWNLDRMCSQGWPLNIKLDCQDIFGRLCI